MKNKISRTRVFDFCLLLLAICSVIGIAQRFGAFRAEGESSLNEYFVEVLWENVPCETADCLLAGETLKTENGTVFGTVKSIRRAPHEVVFHHEGRELRGTFPEGTAEDLSITISLLGRKADATLFCQDGSALLIGQKIRLFAPRASVAATVLSA